MKFWEALPLAVEQGKKIRNDCWGEGNFVWFRDRQSPILFGEDGEPAQLCGWDLLGDWEVYEENPHEEGTGPWAAWWLMKPPEEVADEIANMAEDRGMGPMLEPDAAERAAAIIAADRKEAVAEFARECVRECKAQTYKYTSSRSQSACEEVERRIKRLAREKGIDL